MLALRTDTGSPTSTWRSTGCIRRRCGRGTGDKTGRGPSDGRSYGGCLGGWQRGSAGISNDEVRICQSKAASLTRLP